MANTTNQTFLSINESITSDKWVPGLYPLDKGTDGQAQNDESAPKGVTGNGQSLVELENTNYPDFDRDRENQEGDFEDGCDVFEGFDNETAAWKAVFCEV
ncbi:uncharacterized protein BP5553_03818 [Venustampulla echinocandica]|uniref:Uncharacterized protein n=1 Tax=Venustampulla echinocandica TaxID=2656787 RepID=A0A370TVI7_9HELO|nr:uncharacterized protein BP5553_03818 [Venustampulla echinocandica]RDL39478.1 hypothetical protein BP5553_03818 [Venustampulla echinocandica]